MLSLAGTSVVPKVFAIPAVIVDQQKGAEIRFGIISDLHHLQFGNKEETRIKAFMDMVMKAAPDFIIQCGDFCRPQKSEGIMDEWHRFNGPKYHVLGNHDMDVCDKDTIMKLWGMPQSYYSFDEGGYHFVVMDRNFLKRPDGSLEGYAKSNWGPLPSPQRSFTDKTQLDWLEKDLKSTSKPIIVFMHQPVFLSDFYEEIGNASEILSIFDRVNMEATASSNRGKVAAVFMGHDHDDRYGERNGVHYFLLNSATYVYSNTGAHYYADPLFAMVTLDPSGMLKIEGRNSSFRDAVPEEVMQRFPTRISNHTISL